MKKKICVVTGSRADYGLLYPLLKQLKLREKFILQIAVTGMHLSPKFGLTYKEIEKDGFKIKEKVNIRLSGDRTADISRSVGLGCAGFTGVWGRLRPNLVIVLGDRFEIFAAVVSAFIAKTPIAHIHGGELTEGAMDDAFRHSITKMSFLHFTSAREYRNRVIQLGESPQRVFNVGALGVDNIMALKFKARQELENELNFKFGKKTAMVTFHPATFDEQSPITQFNELLNALDAFEDLSVIFTLPNADLNGGKIIKAIKNHVHRNPSKACSFASLGRINYLSILNQVDLVVGNSSSGIIEVPSIGKPTVNIGIRQKGRIMAGSVINCQARAKDISAAIKKALSPGFRKACQRTKNPYGDGKAAQRIVRVIDEKIDHLGSIRKTFKDS